MPRRVPGIGDLNRNLTVLVPALSASEPSWEIRQAARTMECNHLVQTEVAGHLRGLMTRHSHGVDIECSPWEMTGPGT